MNAPPPPASLAENVVHTVAGNILTSIVLLLIDWLFMRRYGVALHGELVVWALSVVNIAMLFSDLGVAEPAGVRAIARSRAQGDPGELSRTVNRRLTLSLLMALLAAAAVFLFAQTTGLPQRATWLRFLAPWVLLLGGMRACRMILLGFERPLGAVLMHLFDESARLLWLGLCAAPLLGASWILGGWTAVHLLAIAVGTIAVRRVLRRHGLKARPCTIAPRQAFQILAQSSAYFAPTLWMAGVPFLLPLAVGHWHQGTALSIFKICFTWAVLSRIVITPIATVLLPRLAWADAHATQQHGSASAALLPVVRLQGSLLGLAFASVWTFGHPLLALYSPAHAESLATLLVLTVAIGIDDYGFIVNQALMAGRHIRIVVGWEIVKYAALAGLIAWLVPQGGAWGAAWALAGAVAVNTFGKLLSIGREAIRLGAATFAATLLSLAVLTALGLAHPAGRWFALPVWTLCALALRLCRPDEIADWLRTIRRIATARPADQRPRS